MAKLEIVQPPTPPPPPKEFVLTLSPSEAAAVYFLTGLVTGSGKFRMDSNSIYYKLDTAFCGSYPLYLSTKMNVSIPTDRMPIGDWEKWLQTLQF